MFDNGKEVFFSGSVDFWRKLYSVSAMRHGRSEMTQPKIDWLLRDELPRSGAAGVYTPAELAILYACASIAEQTLW